MDRQKLFEDTLEVDSVNKDGKVFEKGNYWQAYFSWTLLTHLLVSRISAHSALNKLSVELDVNTDLYPMDKGEFYKMVIASSITADGSEHFDVMRHQGEGAASAVGASESLFD